MYVTHGHLCAFSILSYNSILSLTIRSETYTEFHIHFSSALSDNIVINIVDMLFIYCAYSCASKSSYTVAFSLNVSERSQTADRYAAQFVLLAFVSQIVTDPYAEAEFPTAGPAAAFLLVFIATQVPTCHVAGWISAAAFGDQEQWAQVTPRHISSNRRRLRHV